MVNTISSINSTTRTITSKPTDQNVQYTVINPMLYTLDSFKKATKRANPNQLSIYYYNDTHGNTDQMAGILSSAKAFKDKMLKEGTTHFVLSAGDNCTGADTKKNNFFFDLMQNAIKVDVSAVGNHECDAGGNGFFEAAKDKKINFIATNVKLDENNPMRNVIKKSIIKEQNGMKFGFIGAMPLDLKTVLKEDAQKGIEVMSANETIQALQAEINNLKQQNVNKIIMVSHSGYDLDKQMAQQLDGVDVIIGGHTHTLVEGTKKGENLVYSKSGEPVLITQAGENAKYYGILNVEFNNSGVLTKANNQVLESPNTKKSPVIETIKINNLGKSPEVGIISEVEPLPKNRRIAPCAWTAMMADSMRSEVGTQIALINSANIRKVPQEGIVTERDIQDSAPMKNSMLKTKVTQKQLVDGIKAAAKQTFSTDDGYPGLIQCSGINYKVDDTGEVLEMSFVDEKGTITPIDINNPKEDVIYTAAYDTFFARADGETPEFAPKFEVEQFDFDKDTTMINYLRKLPSKDKLVIKDDKRLEVIKTNKPKQQGNNSRKFLGLTSLKAS